MEMSEEMILIVECRGCGTLNRKDSQAHSMTCRACETVSAFRIYPVDIIPPQPQSLLLMYNQHTEEIEAGTRGGEELKVEVAEKEKERKDKLKEHFERMKGE